MSKLASRAVVALVASAAIASSTRASAESPAEKCIASADKGQSLRDEGKLVASRAELIACSADVCPSVVRKECVRWLAEVDERIPSVLVSVKDSNGHDAVGVRVTIDGARVAAEPRAIVLDPGTHKVSAVGGSVAPAEETIVLREREKARVVNLVIRVPAEKKPAEVALAPKPKKRIPLASWVLGGVSLVGAGGFAYFWADGMGKVGDLRRSCAPFCSDAQIDDARTPLDVARVSLGVGVAAAVAAVVVYLVQPGEPSQPRRGGTSPFVYAF